LSAEDKKNKPYWKTKNERSSICNIKHGNLLFRLSENINMRARVPVTAVRYHGTIHDFVMLNAITDDPAPHAAIEQACIMLENALSDGRLER
jgi:hypothetical protein